MREMIEKKMEIVDNAVEAMKQAGVEPRISAIRGRYGRRKTVV